MCSLYRAHEDDEHMFLGSASKPRLIGFSIWASNPVAAVWWFGHKITAMVSCFGLQKQVGCDLSVVPQN
jgi:hypothetical protein